DMCIATAAPTEAERQSIPHHLVEILERDEMFSVSDFCKYAKDAVDEIVKKDKVPIIVGGTGLFINSFVDYIKFTETETDFKLREELMKKSVDALYDTLLKIDPEAAENIHKNNKTRVVRALEIYYSSGNTKSVQNEKSRLEKSPYDVLYFVIGFKDRALLYDRINRRVDIMAENGLVDEARRCLESGGKTSAQAIGHKELLPYFNGDVSLDEALDKLKQETRHYAKRQITWFKKRENAVWLYADEGNIAKEAIDKSREFLKNG
ncbi:MAG: tRNA (adenosine(37)-N6)-dimethylallyltransferase MiaA, partial [Eubacterium sp.]|nr:tRNA (adenosine(37)-N6)-dimethylallyltransferase MiaA [Eubacterium sp.]